MLFSTREMIYHLVESMNRGRMLIKWGHAIGKKTTLRGLIE